MDTSQIITIANYLYFTSCLLINMRNENAKYYYDKDCDGTENLWILECDARFDEVVNLMLHSVQENVRSPV